MDQVKSLLQDISSLSESSEDLHRLCHARYQILEALQRMDPLSVTASVISVLQLTNEVIKYLSDVQAAPKECQQCVIEASSLLGPLISLRYHAEQSQAGDPWFEQLRKLNVKDGSLEQYKQALELLRNKTERREGTRRLQHRLLWKINKEQVTDILGKIERLKSLVNIALQMDHRSLSDAIKVDTASIRASIPALQAVNTAIHTDTTSLRAEARLLREDNQSLRQSLLPIHADTTAVANAQDLLLHEKMLEWLSPLDFTAQQHGIIDRREDGTANWFLESAEFQKWLQSPGTTLFCPGIPGAGKTMIAAVVIDYLARVENVGDNGLAYVFCSYKVRECQSVQHILAAILRQLVRSRRDLASPLTSLYTLHVKQNTRPSTQELLDALNSVLLSYSTVSIIFDALDEFSNAYGARREIIDKLCSLHDGGHLRLLFTSRPITEVTEAFLSSPHLEIRATEDDVKRFVSRQIPRLCIPANEQLHRDIKSKIVEAVDGMFLLARLHVDTLLDQTTPKEVRAVLSKLKKGSEALELAYADALDRIDGQSKNHRRLARQALCWLSYAKRPLTTSELCEALAIEPGERFLDRDNMTQSGIIISVCAGLVTQEEESDIIRLIHYTTQEFFEKVRSKWCPHAEREIALSCLTYISFDVFRSGYCDDLESMLSNHRLYKYLSLHWPEHVRAVERESQVSELALSFLRNDALIESITQAKEEEGHHSLDSYTYKFLGPTKGIHLTAKSGLISLAKKLLKGEGGKECMSSGVRDFQSGKTPLSWAASEGHLDLVHLLLDADNDLPSDLRALSAHQALGCAAAAGHNAVVELLLSVDNVVSGDISIHAMEKTPLNRAALSGHETVVRLLLASKKVTNADLQDVSGCSALIWAAKNGFTSIVKQLLASDKLRNANSVDASGRTALSWAVCQGHQEVVSSLLGSEKVSDGDCKDRFDMAPLQYARLSGDNTIARLLLSSGKVTELIGSDNAQFSRPEATHLNSKADHAILMALIRNIAGKRAARLAEADIRRL